MYYKFTKLTKTIIIFNIVLTILIGLTHGYNVHRLKASNERINEYMVEEKVFRPTAIRRLRDDGENLFIDKEFTTFFGVIVSILSLILLLKYAKHNGFMLGFFAAFFCVFTSLLGGMLLFYILFSGKSEIHGKVLSNKKRQKSSLKGGWEEYIHDKSYDLNDNK